MLEQIIITIVEGLPTTIITGVILTPPAWIIETTYSLVILKRKVVVSKQNADFCQKFHEALERHVANPQNRVLNEYVECMEKDLQNRRSIKALSRREKVKKALNDRWRPSIRKSMREYEKEKSYENYKRLKAGLCPVFYRWTGSPFNSLPPENQYNFAKACTSELAWIYVFHCNQAKDFIENSPILRILPFSVKERLDR